MEMSLFLLAIVVIESATLASSAWWRSPTYLRKIIVMQMILIALFAPKLFDIFGFQSNVASVFYAAVFTAQLIVARRWGNQLATDNIWTVLGLMLIFYALVGVLGVMPAANDNDAIFTRALYEIASLSPLNTITSLVAFICAQFVMLSVIARFPKWWGMSLAVVLGQTLDSVIFYPTVFGRLPFETMALIAVDGLITKLVCAILFIPAYLYAIRPPR